MYTNLYLILSENSYTGDELKPSDVKGILISPLKEGEEFVYRQYEAPRKIISTGVTITGINSSPKNTHVDMELILEDNTSQFIIIL